MKKMIIAGVAGVAALALALLFWWSEGQREGAPTEVGSSGDGTAAAGTLRRGVRPAPRGEAAPKWAGGRLGRQGGQGKQPSPHQTARAGERIVGARTGDDGNKIAELAARGDEASVAALIEMASGRKELREAVVGELGRAKLGTGEKYVRECLADDDVGVKCAAIEALGQLKGEEAIGEIDKTLTENRERNDGHRGEIWTACMKALGVIGSGTALPCLERELKWVAEQKSPMEYGLEIIEAISDIGDSRGSVMLSEYAEGIQHKLSGEPHERRRQLHHVMQARHAADLLR